MEETCDKHDDCLGRIHTEINIINTNNAELRGDIKSFIRELQEFRNDVRKDIYDPKDGLGSRVNAHGTQLNLQWGIIGASIVGIIIGVTTAFLRK